MWNWITKLEEIRRSGERAVLVTVTKCNGSTPRAVGAKMIVQDAGRFFGSVGGGALEELALKEARECLETLGTKTSLYPLCLKTGQCCGGSVELMMEVINSGPQLYLFGAGHVGQAVCQTLNGTPFQVHLVDDRDQWINAPAVPAEVTRHRCSWQQFVTQAPWSDDKTYVGVMTHSHFLDEEIISDVVARPARYIGLIGSKTKWDRFSMRLEKRGLEEQKLKRVICPIGTSKCGKAPKEVAISFASQLLSLHYEAH